MVEPKQQPPYPLRMSEEMRSHLEDEAAHYKRSLHAHILALLQEHPLLVEKLADTYTELQHTRQQLERIPAQLKSDISAAAAQGNRSYEEEIVLRLSQSDELRNKVETLQTALNESRERQQFLESEQIRLSNRLVEAEEKENARSSVSEMHATITAEVSSLMTRNELFAMRMEVLRLRIDGMQAREKALAAEAGALTKTAKTEDDLQLARQKIAEMEALQNEFPNLESELRSAENERATALTRMDQLQKVLLRMEKDLESQMQVYLAQKEHYFRGGVSSGRQGAASTPQGPLKSLPDYDSVSEGDGFDIPLHIHPNWDELIPAFRVEKRRDGLIILAEPKHHDIIARMLDEEDFVSSVGIGRTGVIVGRPSAKKAWNWLKGLRSTVENDMQGRDQQQSAAQNGGTPVDHTELVPKSSSQQKRRL